MTELGRYLDVVEHDVLPLTRTRVALGNKLFGAAILRRDDLSVVVAESNNEVENPLWHGEIHAIKRFYEIPASERPGPQDCFFLATHEPCSLCLSGITWSGFTEFGYVFSHRDSAEEFAIPYDIAILKAVYAVPDPDRAEASPDRDLYNRTNAYFTSHDLAARIRATGDEVLVARLADLARAYAAVSATYQENKGGAGIPLA